jgi:hypothetical protein
MAATGCIAVADGAIQSAAPKWPSHRLEITNLELDLELDSGRIDPLWAGRQEQTATPGNANPSIAHGRWRRLGRRFGAGFPPISPLACRGPAGSR